MSSQDMQFADPEWRPPEEREENANAREQETLPPRPINADRREQPQWQTVPPPQEGYLGPGYAGSQPQAGWRGTARPRPRRRGLPWLWIILAFIIIALMSNGFGRGPGGDGGPSPQTSFKEQLHPFKVTGTPTIVINGNVSDINISTGTSSNVVTIEETSSFGNPRDINSTQSGNTITLNADQGGNRDIGLNVTVPTDTNLQLKTEGSIEVNGVNGQMSLQSNTGSITATNDMLTGPSTLRSNNGSVTFSGSIGSGNYQFQSSTNSVNVTLPSASNFHVNANASNNSDQGAISSDFPSVKIQNRGSSTQAQGDVGKASQATVTLQTDTGSITLSASS